MLGFLAGLPWLLSEPSFSAGSWGAVAFMGAVQVGLAYLLMAKGLAHTKPVAANLICMTEPVLNPIWVALFYGETVGVLSLAGIGIVLCGLMVYNVAGAKKQTEAD